MEKIILKRTLLFSALRIVGVFITTILISLFVGLLLFILMLFLFNFLSPSILESLSSETIYTASYILAFVVILYVLYKKYIFKDEIVINSEKLVLRKENQEEVIPLNTIVAVKITSMPSRASKIMGVLHMASLSTEGAIKGALAYEAYKRYFLHIEYKLEGLKKEIDFDISSYGGTASIVEAFAKYGVKIEEVSQDVTEKLSNPLFKTQMGKKIICLIFIIFVFILGTVFVLDLLN